MRVPHIVRIGALVLATTGFYTYVGQMVPQKEVQPPRDATIRSDMTSAEMATIGRQIMEGKGLCLTCHTIGKTSGPFRFPDLAGVDSRAKTRVPGLNDVEYFAQSMYEPTAYVVEGFPPAMPPVNNRAHRNPRVVFMIVSAMVLVLVIMCIAFLQIESRMKVGSLDKSPQRAGEVGRLLKWMAPVDLGV